MKRLQRRLLPTAILLACAGMAQAAQPTDLIISEYIEGSSFNKALEIHNGTGSGIDLGEGLYRLELYSNGSPTPSQSIALTGSLASGAVLVLCHASADAAIQANCNVPSSSVINFNGDDALVLRKASASAGTGTVVDSLGQVGNDPGSQWGTDLASTADNTIRRKADVCTGDTVIDDAFDPAGEWDGYANNTFDGLGSHTLSCSSTPQLGISDASVAEGDAGTTTLTFTVSLTAPAPAGGVTFDIATTDGGTAVAGQDYVAKSLTGQTIPQGETTYSFDVTVNGDTDIEGNESINVTVSNVVGAETGDLDGLGTILNDDLAALSIGQIQGSGEQSPYIDVDVVTSGVVTALRHNGFFIQSAAQDGDPATSDGILVFTGGAPAVAVGDAVQVTGRVEEFFGGSAYPTTELIPSNILVDSSGNALPAPVEITAAMLGPDSLPDVLEHLEGMLVRVAAGRIVAPTPGFANPDSVSAGDSNGAFEIVVADVPRPMREAGISILDPFVVPAPKDATVPYFDANQERLKLFPLIVPEGGTPRVDARGSVSEAIGVLTYFGNADGEDSWELLYDAESPPVIVQGQPQAVSAAGADDLTVAGFNLLRLFNDQEDGAGPVLDSDEFDNRLVKAAAVICNWLQSPDILGAVEVENLATLTSLAATLNDNCASAPNYEARLLEGNDVGGIDVGFLVDTRSVGGKARVEVVEVEQHGLTTLQKNEDGSDSDKRLNDRPPLRLKAVVHFEDGRSYPLTVIVVHQRSLGSVDDTGSGGLGYPSRGAEVRAKRGEQAVELAQLVHDVQTGVVGGNAGEKVVLVGDFNGFDVNDGFVDVMGISTGMPAPEPEVITWFDSPLSPANGGTPLVLGNELIADPEERYSYIFGNISQSLDHAVINEALLMDPQVTNVTVDHARVNADFREAHFDDFAADFAGYTAETPPLRTSDHDPVRVKISIEPLPVVVTCESEGYTGAKLTWCRNICEKGYTGAQLDSWVHRWASRYRDLPYCLVEPQQPEQPET